MVKDELQNLSHAYEKALIENDLAALNFFFWDSPITVRFGQSENLFGAAAIQNFRQQRSIKWLARKVTRLECLVLDEDHGVINLCFTREYEGIEKEGRQTQVWKRFPDLGWKIVSAHVSFMEGDSV
jgi:ketosteroid isomerase-like protein